MKWRRKRRSRQPSTATREPEHDSLPVGYNPHRDSTLYWRTAEGYIIAHDILCQREYVEQCECPACGEPLRVVAQLNRAFQGLNELTALCTGCYQRVTFIFDISNEVYQTWWAGQLGPAYVVQYDGPPREPVSPG